ARSIVEALLLTRSRGTGILAADARRAKAKPMVSALLRAFADLSAPPLRRVVALALLFAAASFAGLWIAVAIILDHSASFGWRVLDWLIQLLGALAVAGLSWLLFPAVATMVMGFFVERVAGAVEAL